MTKHPFLIESDALYPRDAENRFRIYGRKGEDLNVLATAPSAEAVGIALITMHDDARSVGARLADEGVIGVLDVLAADWVVLPWERNEEPLTFGKKPRRVKEPTKGRKR